MKSDELLDAIGEAKDEYVQDVREGKVNKMPTWGKWTSAVAACLVVVFGVNIVMSLIGANAGTGGDNNLNYMYYVGLVLPMTVQGDSSGIKATRNVDYDFSGYYTYQNSFEDINGETVFYDMYDNKALVTDSYVLHNTSEKDKTVTLLYPFTGNMSEQQYYPSISVDGKTVSTVMHPGPYSGGFEGAWGSDEAGTVNLNPPKCFEDYQALLGTDAYRNSALDAFPELDQRVYVYQLHDFVYSKTTEDVNPTLAFTFYIDYEKTTVMSYGMNGSSWNPETGYCSRSKSGIEYRPNVDPEFQHPDDGYIVLLGEDLTDYTLQGYQDGGCDKGEELNDLSCAVTRYETTLGGILSILMEDLLRESILQEDSHITEEISADNMSVKDLYLGLAAELLYSYGLIGETPMERYDAGMIEDYFSGALSHNRVIYLSFDVTIPAGKSVTVDATLLKDASVDFVGNDKGKDGFDMATKLGTNLTFTEQTASICRYEEIEIVDQNFGFDLENGVTKVTLDLNQDHYWLQVCKISKK